MKLRIQGMLIHTHMEELSPYFPRYGQMCNLEMLRTKEVAMLKLSVLKFVMKAGVACGVEGRGL